ncbi:TIGR00159 family protein [Candidatus Peregrinibacteria bacterium]|nr:TIGR00159 family protein [Candidatus Peregrinibacteria bacterium]
MINVLSSAIAQFINAVSSIAKNILENLNVSQYSMFQIAVDILLVAILFYWLIMLIRGTRAVNVILGVVVIVIVFAISRWLQLLALGWLLDRLLTVTLVALPVIFQQELRRGLEKLGRTKFFMAQEAKEIDFIRSEVIGTCFEMSKKKIGALIVFCGEVNLKEYIDTGILLSSRISKELLLSIFSTASPLHDGAVIIDENKIVAAGCVLPHSFKEEYSHRFGTRHKAALGLSETTDARIFVISEQRGTVSYVVDGHIEEDITPERAQTLLTEILTPKKRQGHGRKIANKLLNRHKTTHV